VRQCYAPVPYSLARSATAQRLGLDPVATMGNPAGQKVRSQRMSPGFSKGVFAYLIYCLWPDNLRDGPIQVWSGTAADPKRKVSARKINANMDCSAQIQREPEHIICE
jgi:hypothetical protein